MGHQMTGGKCPSEVIAHNNLCPEKDSSTFVKLKPPCFFCTGVSIK